MTPPDRWTALEEAARKATPGKRTAVTVQAPARKHGQSYVRPIQHGYWNGMTEEDAALVALCDPATIQELIAAAREGRTKGTVEVCKHYGRGWPYQYCNERCTGGRMACKQDDCPLRTTQGDQT